MDGWMGESFLLLFLGGLNDLSLLCLFFGGMTGLHEAGLAQRMSLVETSAFHTADADEGRRSWADWRFGRGLE